MGRDITAAKDFSIQILQSNPLQQFYLISKNQRLRHISSSRLSKVQTKPITQPNSTITPPTNPTQKQPTSELEMSPSTSPSLFKSLAHAAKAHHESVNAAFTTFYGQGMNNTPTTTPAPTPADTPRASIDSERSVKSESGLRKSWEKVRKAAKEHHESVNGAYEAYYGAGMKLGH